MIQAYPRNTYKPFRKILKTVGTTCATYKLIEPGDRIMVAVSGGKDSLCMLSILIALQKKAPFEFEIFAFTLDQGQPDFASQKLKDHFASYEIENYVELHDTFSIVQEKLEENQTQCFLCSRMRRGILYSRARELGANKIALGHHSDDAFQTLLLNLFYSGRNAAIPPLLLNDQGDVTVIRPLIELDETLLIDMAEHMQMPILPCNVCGSQDNLQRQRMKRLLKDEELINPSVRSSMKKALKTIQPRHLWDQDYE